MTKIHILADDLTGALDSVAEVLVTAPVHVGTLASSSNTQWYPVEALTTGSRDIHREDLPDRLNSIMPWLESADLCIKKVDSLLRGNTFDEVAWVARAGRFRQIVFTPAFPKLGRVTFDLHHWLSAPVDSSNSAVLTQIDNPSLQTRFTELGLEVSKEKPELQDALRVWVPDVRNEQDLQHIATLAENPEARDWLWCGSGGLANTLLKRFCASAQGKVWEARSDGPCVLISSSFQESFKRQWHQIKQALGKPLCVEGADTEQLQQALMQDAPSDTLSMFDLSPTVRLTADAASALRSAQIATLIHKLPKPGALLVIGGDTFLDIVQASGANTIVAGPSVRAGWGYARLQGGLWDGVICHSRSGAFGDDDDLIAMVRIVNCATALI